MSSTKFSTFTEMKIDDIRKLAATLFSKSCVLDPLNNALTYCCLLLLTLSTSLFVMAACLHVWNLQYCHLCSRNLMQTFYNSRTLDPSRT